MLIRLAGALVATLLIAACADSSPVGGGATSPIRATVRDSESRAGALPSIVELRGDVRAVRIRSAGYEVERELSDAELIAGIEAAGGRAWVGFKPRSTVRSAQGGVTPAMTKAVALAARARVLAVPGVILARSFATDASIVVELPAATALTLRQMDEVDYVEPVRPLAFASGDSLVWGLHKNRGTAGVDPTTCGRLLGEHFCS